MDTNDKDSLASALPGLETDWLPIYQNNDPPNRAPHYREAYAPDLPLTDKDIARFHSRVVRSPRCWFWIGAISTPDSYGRFTWRSNGRYRTLSAHRVAALIAGVDLTDGHVLEHVCNEPLCVRVHPDHVRITTQSHNITYAVETGRHNGTKPTHTADRATRSQHIRHALKNGWKPTEFQSTLGSISPPNQPTLF